MTNKRGSISDSLRKSVLVRDKYRCRYCGHTDLELCLDHVYPVARGGETTYENLVTACVLCNSAKSDKVGIWPKPIDYFEVRNCLIKLQTQNDSMLCNEQILITAEFRKIQTNEGKLILEDIGRVALKLKMDIVFICNTLESKDMIRKVKFLKQVEKWGAGRFLERAKDYDRKCKFPLLQDISA